MPSPGCCPQSSQAVLEALVQPSCGTGKGNRAAGRLLKKNPQTSQLNCVWKWEWACIIIWIFYPLTATARAQSKAEWTKICRKCSSALSILLAKEQELLLGDEAEEEEPVQRNGESSALQSSVLGGNKGKTVSPLAIHPLHLELPSCRPIPSINSGTKKNLIQCALRCFWTREGICWRDFFPWKEAAPLQQERLGHKECVWLRISFSFSSTFLFFTEPVNSIGIWLWKCFGFSFCCHVSAIGSRGVWGHPWAWRLCKILQNSLESALHDVVSQLRNGIHQSP